MTKQDVVENQIAKAWIETNWPSNYKRDMGEWAFLCGLRLGKSLASIPHKSVKTFVEKVSFKECRNEENI